MKFVPLSQIAEDSSIDGGGQAVELPSRGVWESNNPGADYDAAMAARASAPAMEVQPTEAPTPTLKFVPLAAATAPASRGILDTIGSGMNVVRDWATGVPINAGDRKKSVLEGKQIPELPSTEATRAAKVEADRLVAIGAAKEAKTKAVRDKLRTGAKEENYGITDFAKDTGLDVSKGVADLGESYVGLLDITSGGAAGRVLSAAGYKPKKIDEFLTGFQSLTRQNAAKNVEEATGFLDTLKELAVNPTALIGSVAESLPGTVTAGAAAGRFVRFLAGKATAEAASLGLRGSAAEQFITNKIKDQSFKIAGAAGGAEGVITAGSTAEAGRQAGKDWNEYVLPALAAGFGTAAIGVASGRVAQKMGIGDVETAIAARSAGIKGLGTGEGPFLTKFVKEIAKEGFLEEMPQSAQEQIFRNLATGRPWDEGIDKAAAQGLVAGVAMAGGHSAGAEALRRTSTAIKAALPEERESTAGLAEFMAKSKGFLVPEGQAPEKLSFVPLAEVQAPEKLSFVPLSEVSTPTAAPVVPAEREEKIKELALKIADITGATDEDATKIATQRVEKEEQAAAKTAAVPEAIVSPEPVSGADTEGAAVVEQPREVTPAAGVAEAEQQGVVPTGLPAEGVAVGEEPKPSALNLEVAKRDASDTFGAGAERVRYTDPASGGSTEVLVRPDGSASVLSLEVPEEFRGKGIGEKLQAKVLEDYPQMQGQVSSKAAATTAYRLGRRPPGKPTATLQDVFKTLEEDSSVNMVSPEMQTKFEAQETKPQEGKPSGIETPETKQAEAQGQEAPAGAGADVVEQAKTAITEIKKRGRPSAVLTQTPEEVAANAQQRKDKNKAQTNATNAVARLAKEFDTLVTNKATKQETIRKLLGYQAITGTRSALGIRVAEMLKHPSVTAEDIANAKHINELAKTQTLSSTEGAAAATVADPTFSKFTNGVQAISHIIKTGNQFQKLVGERIRGFVNGVQFVVLEKDSPIPKRLQSGRASDEWAKARAMYLQDDATGEKIVYVRGASYGEGQGANNIVVLHELLHAATNQKLKLGLTALRQGFSPTNAVTQATADIQQIMASAKARFDELVAAGELPPEIRSLKEHGSIFTSPQEFVAYGMSDEAMQTFLLGAKGTEDGPSFFNRFVGAIRKLFNIGANENNAMADLVLATDKLLSAKKSGVMRFLETADKALAQRTEPTTLKAAQTPEEVAKQLDKDVTKAEKTVVNSKEGEELGESVSVLAALREPSRVWEALSTLWDGVSDSARSRISNFFDLSAIAHGPGERIPALRDVYKLSQQMSGMEQNIQRSTSRISEQAKRFYRANTDAVRVAFENLVHTSTLSKYDPAKAGTTARNKTLDDAFNALPEQGQQLYRDLRDYYKEMNELQVHILTENLDRLDIPDEDRTKMIAGIREAYQKENLIEPYFPLMRHGDFVLKVGKPGSANYLSMRFDTKAERERAAHNYARSQGESAKDLESIGHIKKSEDTNGVELRKSIEASSAILKAGYATIDAAPIGYAADPASIRAEMKDQMYQAYLAAMPEGSIRKLFIHREGTAGFSSDVLRNLNVYGAQASKSYSRLKFGAPIRQALESAERWLVGPEAKYKPFVTRAKEIIAQNLEFQQKTGVQKGGEQIADVITKVSFIRNLTSWSSAMLQPGEILLKGIPVLTGNHGPKAVLALTKRMKIWNQYGTVQKNADGTTTWRAPSIEFASGLTPDQRRAVRDMVSMYGVSTDTLANDVFKQARKQGSKLDSKWMENSKDAANTLIMGGLMHHGERLSREVLFLTSYDLYRSEDVKHEDAVYSAVQEVTEALGDYSATNKPMVMRGAVGKLATMYKFFPLVTTKLLVGNFFRMLPLMNKEGKKAAATKFFGVMGTHLLAGGLTALPMFGIVMSILGAAWAKWGKDPDAPAEMKDVDYLTWWKTEYMQSVFGSTHIAETLKTGLLNKLTGWDISSRISLNDMWFRELPHSKNVTETAMNMVAMLAGPAFSTGLDMAKGIQLGMNGEYQLALEKLAPASVSKLLIAHRYGEEGVQTTQGVKLLEKGMLPTSTLAGQAIGFRPAKLAEAQEKGFKAAAAEKKIIENKNKIANDIKDNFRKSMDLDQPESYRQRFDDKFDETVDKLREFNAAYPKYKFEQGAISTLLHEDRKLKANLEMNAGAKFTPKNAALIGDAVDSAIEDLESYDKKEKK